MLTRRGVVASVLRTLSFHLATLAFACVLGTFFAISGSALLLVVGCLLVGSSQFARKLTRILWRTEMAIDALVADEEELGLAVRRQVSGSRGEDAGQQRQQQREPVLGEVTLPVMMLSLLYFLVFKWILDLIFSSLPVALWLVSVAQVLPQSAGLSDVSFVSTGTTAAQAFTALAFAFLAHQLGVTSARGLLFVSRNVSEVLFKRQESADTREVQTDREQVEGGRGREEKRIGPGASSNYGTMGGDNHQRSKREMDESAAVSTSELLVEDVARNLYQEGRSSSESNVSRPRVGPRAMKQHPASFDGADFPYVAPGMHPLPPPRELPHAERAFQNEAHDHSHDQEFQMCCCKVVINSDVQVRSESDVSDSHRGRGDSGGRGGYSRGGGRGNSSSRGGFGWGRRGGRGGVGFDQLRPDARRSLPVPPFVEFPPWGADWRERWLEHWSGWRDWRWPEMDHRRRQMKGRRGMRRRNSFDDVYAVAVPVAASVPDSDDSMVKEPAHKSMYEALDLRPSAPPLPHHRPRWGSDDIQWDRATLPDTRDERDNHREDSLHKSMSEPAGRYRYSQREDRRRYESGSDLDSNEDDVPSSGRPEPSSMDTDAVMHDLPHDHRRLSEVQTAFRENFEHGSSRDIGHGAAEWERAEFDHGPKAGKFRQKRAEWKQRRYQKKVEKYELKLRAAREKAGKSDDEDADIQQRYIQTKERDRYAKEIEQAADEAFHKPGSKQHMARPKRSSPLHTAPKVPLAATTSPVVSSRAAPAPPAKASGDPRKRALSSRIRGRSSMSADQQVRSASGVSDKADTVEHDEQEEKRPLNIAHISQARSGHDISDFEIQGNYGNITRSYEDDDVTNMRAYAPLSYAGSPPEYITALDPSPIYRGPSEQPDYDSFSPMGTPRSVDTGRRSFGEMDHDYDLLSPTNSIHDAEFPTDKFQQVYRSIQMAAAPPPRRAASSLAAEEGGLDEVSEFKGVPGRRDRVNFSAFAPPSICPSPKPFQFTVWAFLLNQRDEMQELARRDQPESRKLSLETKLNVRRGALVHVTLEVPNGFQVLNGATQGFAWEGEISSVDYDVVCTDGAAFGRVLFKARITVGSSVAVLNSFVLVGSRAVDPSELEADVLEGWMDVMEQTYREIPFRSLEMKELVGQGYFGDAYRASLDGHDVVVKTIRASEFGETTSQIVREFQHEAAMLNMFGHHPCIVPFVGASTDTKFPLALVTKYLPYGSLEDNLRGSSSASSTLTVDERTGMLKDAAAGLLNIHEGGFIHRDLAARNCLVDQGLRVRICDFGLCRRVRSETAGMLMKDAVGPVKYMAPESLQPPHAFSYDSDVYMFGVLMWETFTSSPPFASLTPVEAMMHVLRGERLPVPKELPASLQTLMQNCFSDSPAERPSMQEVLTALDDSLVSSQRASVAIAARTAVATATAAAATNTAMAKSVALRTNLRREQDRSIWV